MRTTGLFSSERTWTDLFFTGNDFVLAGYFNVTLETTDGPPSDMGAATSIARCEVDILTPGVTLSTAGGQ